MCHKVGTWLHLAFENRPLRDICLSESAAAEAFGVEVANFLRARLADMIVAESLGELVTGNVRPVPGSDSGLFVVDLGTSAQLRFRANHPKAREGSALLPDRISRVIVLSVEVNDVPSG